MSTGEPQDAGLERVNGGVRSVQTLPAAGGVEMPEFMDAYFRWLQRAFRGAVTVSGGACDEVVVMYLLGVPAVRLRRRSSDVSPMPRRGRLMIRPRLTASAGFERRVR